MALHDGPSIYQAIRLDLEPASSTSTVDITLSSPRSSASLISRASPKRRRLEGPTTTSLSEATFSDYHIATESSIHFRRRIKDVKKQPNPRSVLWRVLEDRKVLELQAVDLYYSVPQEQEPLLTLRLSFPHALRPSTLAFVEADVEAESENSELIVFAITTQGELYTLRLRKEAFVNADYLGTNTGWCSASAPNALGYRTPYRLIAKDERELWLSLTDGGLMRLQKRSNDNDSSWRETFFTEGSWKASVRGLIPWKAHSSVKHAGADVGTSAAAVVAAPSGSKYVWTVCLDHTLKVWSIETGKVAYHIDLTDESRDVQKPSDFFIDPSHAELLKIFPSKSEAELVVAVFSPKTHEFKFWNVTEVDGAPLELEDARPDVRLIAPFEDLLNATVWILESFHLKRLAKDQGWVLWILVRSGIECHVYRLKFKFGSSEETLTTAWTQGWVKVHQGYATNERLRSHLDNPSDFDIQSSYEAEVGVVEDWMRFLFVPGRFTVPVLETALAVFLRGQDEQEHLPNGSTSTQSLEERVCRTIGTSVVLGKLPDGSPAYDAYERDLSSQFRVLYGLVKTLHKRQEAPLSLAYDADDDVPWLVFADCVAPLRTCCEAETLWHNQLKFAEPAHFQPTSQLLQHLPDSRDSGLGQIFHVLVVFRDCFPRAFVTSFRTCLLPGILQSSNQSIEEHMESLFDRTNFGPQVNEEDYNKLVNAVNAMGGFQELNNENFGRVVDLLDEEIRGNHQKKYITRYGKRALIRGAQETLQLGSEILLDMLLLVMFMAHELEDLPEEFDAPQVYTALCLKLREYELLGWLANNRPRAPQRKKTIADDVQSLPESTLLESIFIHDWSTMKTPAGSTIDLLSYWCRAWTFGAQLSKQYSPITAHILANLLRSREFDLAFTFVKFVPSTAWTNYLKGRLNLSIGDFLSAAVLFKDAADELTKGYFDFEHHDSANVLDPDERQRLSSGAGRYYQHIARLFESVQSMSYVVDFARLALEDIEKDTDELVSDEQQPRASNVDIKSDLLSRLFTASLQTARFSDAFDTLQQYTDLALRKSALHALLRSLLLAPRSTPLLLSLPFSPALALEVDAYLASLATSPSASSFPSPPHRTLYAWRASRGDLKGAATCLWERLQILDAGRPTSGTASKDAEKEELFLALINALSLVEEDDAWLLTRPLQQTNHAKTNGQQPVSNIDRPGAAAAKATKPTKRCIVTLSEVRRLWQEEMDRVADVEAGRFTLENTGLSLMDGAQDDVVGHGYGDGDGDGDDNIDESTAGAANREAKTKVHAANTDDDDDDAMDGVSSANGVRVREEDDVFA